MSVANAGRLRVLLVGGRDFGTEVHKGPESAFENLIRGFEEIHYDATVFPDRLEGKLRTYTRLLKLLFSRRWDVINVHLSSNYGLLVGLLPFCGRRRFLTVHGYSPIETAGHPYNAVMHSVQVKYMFRRRVYVSDLIRERVEKHEGLTGGYVIPNAIDISLIEQIRSARKYEKNVDVFSLCGYNPIKGVSFLESAVKQASRRIVCSVAGHWMPEGWPQGQGLPEGGQLTFEGPIGHEEGVRRILQARVYVQPSQYESFGIPVLEAMAAGTPVVVCKGAGVAHYIRDGVDGLVVKYGDTRELLAAITSILDNDALALRLTEAGKRTAARFAPSAVAGQYVSFFESFFATGSVPSEDPEGSVVTSAAESGLYPMRKN